jgi:hypothetical protein
MARQDDNGGIDDVRFGRVTRFTCVVVALAAAFVLLGASFLALATLRAHIELLSPSNGVARFDAIVLRMRLAGVSFTVLALVLLRCGPTLDQLITAVASAWWASCRGAPERLVRLYRNDRIGLLGLGGLVTVAIGLRLVYLSVPLRYDEATTWFSYVSKPVYVALSNYSAPNNHLLNTALAKVSVTVLGDGPAALRLPALLAAIVAVPAAFALGRMLYGRAAALLAAGLVASSSTLVEYSANARGYALVVLLTLLALLAAGRVVQTDSIGAWAAVAATLALGLYAVPTTLYAAFGVLLWISLSQLLADGSAKRVLRRTGACALSTAMLALLLYSPVLVVSGPRALTSNQFVSSLAIRDFLSRLPSHASATGQTWIRDIPLPCGLALTLLLVASLLLTPRVSRFRLPPLAALVAAAVIVLLAQRAIPFTRVWLFLVPVAAATCAGLPGWLLDRTRWGYISAPALAIAVALAGAAAVLAADSPRTSRETGGLLDAPAVARYLAGVITPSDRILATGSDTILTYYLHRDGVSAESMMFTTAPRQRVYVVVNVLGHQNLEGVLADLGKPRNRYAPARLLRRWPSAQVFLLERRR